MESQEGEMLAYANSLWTYIDVKTGHPVNVGEEQIKAYELEEKLDMDYASRKVVLPQTAETYPSFSVRPHHLDTNHHVNNGQYVLMAQEYLPSDFQVKQMRAEYKRQAVLHDVIVPRVHREENLCTVVLENLWGEIYTAVELKR